MDAVKISPFQKKKQSYFKTSRKPIFLTESRNSPVKRYLFLRVGTTKSAGHLPSRAKIEGDGETGGESSFRVPFAIAASREQLLSYGESHFVRGNSSSEFFLRTAIFNHPFFPRLRVRFQIHFRSTRNFRLDFLLATVRFLLLDWEKERYINIKSRNVMTLRATLPINACF